MKIGNLKGDFEEFTTFFSLIVGRVCLVFSFPIVVVLMVAVMALSFALPIQFLRLCWIAEID